MIKHTLPVSIDLQYAKATSTEIIKPAWTLTSSYSNQISLNLQCDPFQPETTPLHWQLSLTATIEGFEPTAPAPIFIASTTWITICQLRIPPQSPQHPNNPTQEKLREYIANTIGPIALAHVRQHLQHNLHQAGYPSITLPPLQSSALVNLLPPYSSPTTEVSTEVSTEASTEASVETPTEPHSSNNPPPPVVPTDFSQG